MKKVLYIGNHLKGGNPTTSNQLSLVLKELEIEVASYSNKKNKIFRLLHMCWGLLKHRKASIVLIDTYSTLNFYYALIVSQLARLFYISYIPILHGGNLPKRLQEHPRLSRLIFSNATINIAPSKYLKEVFLSYNFKTEFIANGIDLQYYSFKKRKQLAPKLLWVRAFDQIYNPFMAIAVLEALKKTYPKAQLCMVGPDKDGSLQQAKALARLKKLTNNIEFTGYLTKEEWLQKAKNFDIFINTTTIDNTPVSVIEAMALGLPVVSTNVGGIPYLIAHEETGLLVESKNVEQMVAKILYLLNHESVGQQLTINARAMISKFDLETVKQSWKKILS